MGLDFSCPLASYCDLETVFQSFMVKSINLANNDISKGPVRSNSFNGSKPKSTFFQSEGCRKMRIESHVSLKITENETQVSIEAPFGKEIDFEKPKHEAAIKLQKVYKSFRTRRKLADCAVLIEPNWWKLLDFAELKRSSISFFEINKPETAVSRWSRAKTRAAKVGKGLSKNSRARKMALQHWLEAIDPRHRYGHNLHFYYVKWLHSQSKEPFFYWLDIGEGKELNLVEKCPRSKLQLQCIKYLGPMERMPFEVIVEDGKFLYKQSGELLDTREKTKGAKWIFVLSTSMSLYVGQKKKGFFQHSSFLAGGATSAAGRIVVENGILKAVWPHSGHYRPTPENFQDFISFLRGCNVDLADVKMNPDEVEEEEELSRKSNKVFLRSMSSEEDLSENVYLDIKELDSDAKNLDSTKILTNLSIPDGEDDFFEEMEIEKKSGHENIITEKDFSDDEEEENKGDGSMEEAILKRINSHKEMNYSYQLGKQLSCKWTTGAGPRIGCMKDYPPKLQFHFLEKSNLSPRSCGGGGSHLRTFSSIVSDLQK